MSKYEIDEETGEVLLNHSAISAEDVVDRLNDLEAKLAESEKPKEIRFNGFVADCNYDEARKVLQEDILKMQAENKKLKESEELNNYAKCILENKKLEEDLELSEKCCIEYEEEITQLKQQLAEKEEQLAEYSDINNALNSGLKDKCISCEEEHNQDKISFAVEKIQELKKSLRDKVCLMENDEHCYPQNAVHWQDVVALIENQINVLKNGTSKYGRFDL